MALHVHGRRPLIETGTIRAHRAAVCRHRMAIVADTMVAPRQLKVTASMVHLSEVGTAVVAVTLGEISLVKIRATTAL